MMKKKRITTDFTIHVGLDKEDHETVLQMAKKVAVPKSTMARMLIKEAMGARKSSTKKPK